MILLGGWWYAIGIVLLLAFCYGAGAAGRLGHKGGQKLIAAVALLSVVAAGFFIFSEDAPRVFEWIGDTLRKRLGEF